MLVEREEDIERRADDYRIADKENMFSPKPSFNYLRSKIETVFLANDGEFS